MWVHRVCSGGGADVSDEILRDALKAWGFERITAWHLACVESFLGAVAVAHRRLGGVDQQDLLDDRLESDMRLRHIDDAHVQAQWEEAQRTARTTRRVFGAVVGHPEPEQEELLSPVETPPRTTSPVADGESTP